MIPTPATITGTATQAGTTRRRATIASIGLGLLLVAMTASPTLAFDNNAPNATVAGNGVSVSAFVACDAASGTMHVSATASTMQPEGFAGPVAGPYDAGQWVRYDVFAREVGANDWTEVYAWSNWEWIVSLTSTMYVEMLQVPQDLGASDVSGTVGHNYEILVQVDYWTGVENVVNVTPTYAQALATDWNTYYLTPSYCHL
ncbi:MAG: hypothetical protein ABIR11_07275 [Candidatus Limnocylindrales bacterium]